MMYQALVEHKICSRSTTKGGNKKEANTLVLTKVTTDRDTAKVFKHLYSILFAQNVIFDPLDLFTDDEERATGQTTAHEEEDEDEDEMY